MCEAQHVKSLIETKKNKKMDWIQIEPQENPPKPNMHDLIFRKKRPSLKRSDLVQNEPKAN